MRASNILLTAQENVITLPHTRSGKSAKSKIKNKTEHPETNLLTSHNIVQYISDNCIPDASKDHRELKIPITNKYQLLINICVPIMITVNTSIAGLMGLNRGHWLKSQIRPDMSSNDVLMVYRSI